MFQGPYLQINIQDGAWRSRVKRTTSRVCSEEFDPDVTQCCKWPLKIDFAEFGWDWVLSPETYDADFCAGDCSLGEKFTHNTLIIFMTKFFTLGNVVESPHANIVQMSGPRLHSSAGPCCAPRKMSPIYMLYLDADQNVIKGKLPNMKVQRCGCS